MFHPTLPSCTAQRCCLSQHEETTVCVPRSTVKGCHVSQREVSNLCPIQHFLHALYKDVQVSQREVSTVCVSSNTAYVHCVWMSEWVNIKWAQSVSHPTLPTCTVSGCLSESTSSEQSVSHPTLPTCTVSGCLSKSTSCEHSLCPIQHFLRALCLDVWVSQHHVSTLCVPSNTSNVHCVWMSKWVIKWAHPIPSNTSYVHCTRMSCKTMRSERSVSHPTLPTCTVQGCLSESMWSEHRLCTHEHCTRMWGKSMRTCGISALQKRCQVFALAQPTPAAVSPIAGSVAATPSSLQSFSSPF